MPLSNPLDYKLDWPKSTTQLAKELACYRHNHTPEKGGLGKFQHLKNAYALLYPDLIPSYFSWTEYMLKAFCNNSKIGGGTVAILGGAGTSKSFTAGHWALLDFLADPENTVIICASTTLEDLNQRIWKYVKQAYQNLYFKVGKFRKSKPEAILFKEGGIFTAALDDDPEGEKLKGYHPRRLRIIIDEATAMSPSILALYENWASAQKEFILITLSNFRGLDNLCAATAEPLHGWSTVDFNNTTTWKTKRGEAVLLDLTKSPVYLNPALETKLPFIRTKESIDKTIKSLGRFHPRVMQYIRSIPVIDSTEKTVCSPKLLELADVYRIPKWAGFTQTKLAALDPAFTTDGDECILLFATLGYESTGKQILAFDELISIPIDSNSRTPTEYQVLKQVVQECEQRNISPRQFIMDACGVGRGIGSIFEKEWSPDINKIMASQTPTDNIVDFEFRKTGKELYDRLVTELWWEFRRFIESGQIAALDEIAGAQFCSRLYDDTKAKIKLETKYVYKKRMYGEDAAIGSPDRADCCTYMLVLAKMFGLELSGRAAMYEKNIATGKSAYQLAVEEKVQEWLEQRNSVDQGEVANPLEFNWNSVVIDESYE